MKGFADGLAFVVIGWALGWAIWTMSAGGVETVAWKYERGASGICYEVRQHMLSWVFMSTDSMSPVDDHFCEEKP